MGMFHNVRKAMHDEGAAGPVGGILLALGLAFIIISTLRVVYIAAY